MNINAKGIFLGCHGVLPYMLKTNYGRYVPGTGPLAVMAIKRGIVSSSWLAH